MSDALPPIEEIALPTSLAEAVPQLSARVIGLVPFQIRATQLDLQGIPQAADAAAPLVADYFASAVLDQNGAQIPVNDWMLERWGVDIDSVLTVAARADADSAASVFSHEGVLVIAGSEFAAAALRDPAALDKLFPDDTPVVIAPTSHTLIVGVAEDTQSIAVLARTAEQALANEPRSVSMAPLVRVGERWEPFAWPSDAAVAVRALTQRWNDVQYAAARDTITSLLESHGLDTFVAEHVLAQNADGARMTFASLTEGVETVLPRAEHVVLLGQDGRMKQVSFEQLVTADGVLEHAAALVPEYYLVQRFPSELLDA